MSFKPEPQIERLLTTKTPDVKANDGRFGELPALLETAEEEQPLEGTLNRTAAT